jgi:DNA-binding transcriptional ArsR family regulator
MIGSPSPIEFCSTLVPLQKQEQNKIKFLCRRGLYLTDTLFNLMVMKNLDHAYAALADPTRRAILARLALGEATVGEIADPFPISGPAISRHLKVLEEAQLITRTRRSQQFVCRLNPEGLKNAQEWLDYYRAFWTGAFDRLDEHLKRNPQLSPMPKEKK